MRFVGVGVAIVVEMIGVGEMGFNVVTFWTSGDGIRTSEMRFGVRACIDETC